MITPNGSFTNFADNVQASDRDRLGGRQKRARYGPRYSSTSPMDRQLIRLHDARGRSLLLSREALSGTLGCRSPATRCDESRSREVAQSKRAGHNSPARGWCNTPPRNCKTVCWGRVSDLHGWKKPRWRGSVAKDGTHQKRATQQGTLVGSGSKGCFLLKGVMAYSLGQVKRIRTEERHRRSIQC
jgi:hypothetical protein